MKNLVLALLSVVMLSSCGGIKNTVRRASVSEGDTFVKENVVGFENGVVVHKGSECMMTPKEIKRHYKEVDRANELKRQERLDSIKKADEDLMNYIRKVTQAYQDTAS